MKNYTALKLVLLLASIIYGQNESEFIPAQPVLGYSSINDNISYYDIARRAGIQSEFEAIISIDSTGNISDLKFKPIYRDSLNEYDSIITNRVKKVLMKLEWKSATLKDKPVNSTISIPFIFMLKSNYHNYEKDKKDAVELISDGLRQEPIIKISTGSMMWICR